MKTQRGVTFIELIFAISIAGILISVGIPGFIGSMRNSDMSAAANTFVGAVHAARSESVKARSRVTVCRGDTSGANPACDNNGDALIVFINDANDSSFDNGTDTLIRSTPWLQDDMSVTAPDLPGYVTFTPQGVTRAINGDAISGTLMLCGPSGNKHARVVTLSPTGRPVVQHHRDAINPANCPTT
ncbi:MAG: GspH/FimT family pseudopilin [Pseudomonadota bacterium]